MSSSTGRAGPAVTGRPGVTADPTGPAATVGTRGARRGRPAGPTDPTGPAVPAVPAVAAVAADAAVGPGHPSRTIRARGARPAGPTGPAVPAGPAMAAHRSATTTGPTGPTVTAVSARRTRRTRPTIAAGPAVAMHTGAPAVTPSQTRARRLRIPPAAIARNEPAVPAIGIGRRPISAVAHQRTPRERLDGFIDRTQRVALQGRQRRRAGRLSARIPAPRTSQRLDKLGMKHRRPRGKRLKRLGVPRKQRRHRRRHLILRRSDHRSGLGCCRRVGRTQRRTQTRHIRGGRRQQLRCCYHIRHGGVPIRSSPTMTRPPRHRPRKYMEIAKT